MNIQYLYQDIADYIDAMDLGDIRWRVLAQKADTTWDFTVVLNVIDSEKSPDSDVCRIDVEFIVSNSTWATLATVAKTLHDSFDGYRGIFVNTGVDTRSFITEGVHRVRVDETRDEGQAHDIPHLSFVVRFFVEPS